MIIALFYDLLFLLPMTVAICSVMTSHISKDAPGYALTIAVISAFFILLFRHLRLRGRLLLSGLFATFLLAFILYHPKGERIGLVSSYSWALYMIGISILCFIFHLLSQKYTILRLIAAVSGIILTAVFFIGKDGISKTAVIAVFFFALVTAADMLQRRSIKSGDTDAAKHLVFVSPFILVPFLAVALIKVPTAPYDWGFVTRSVNGLRSTVAKIGDSLAGVGWDGDGAFIGFSGRGTVGGNITGMGYKVMDINASAPCDPSLYLAGMVFDDFDGQRWSPYAEDPVYDGLDTLETVGAILSKTGDAPVRDNIKNVNLIVDDKGTGTSVSFLPPKMVPDSLSVGGKKSVSFYRLNSRSSIIDDVLSGKGTLTVADWELARSECGVSGKKEYDYDRLTEYRAHVYETYLPDTVISGRLRAYTDEVIKGSENDREKLSKIAEMLRGFGYTDRPGDLPDTIGSPADYLDYLIFEKKEGYCSYYATAFVLIARAYGIPARYVQGYRCDTSGNLHFTVNSTDAHAWPEAYIEGAGWVIFEPTPGYGKRAAPAGWKTEDETEHESYHPDYADTADTDSDTADTGGVAGSPRKTLDFSRILIPVLCGAGFTLLLFAADAALRKRRYKRLDERQKALWQCKRAMLILKRKGYAIKDGETLSEYQMRLEGALPSGFTGFLDTYERLLYSDFYITEMERRTLEENIKSLKSCHKAL